MDKAELEKIVTGGILATLGSAITALTNTSDPNRVKVKNFLAGIFAGGLVSLILRNSTWGETVKELLIVLLSSFVSTYWPLLEKIGKKILLQKVMYIFGIQKDKDVSDTNNN